MSKLDMEMHIEEVKRAWDRLVAIIETAEKETKLSFAIQQGDSRIIFPTHGKVSVAFEGSR